MAKILAHDLVQVYLEDKLLAITNKGIKEKSQHNHNAKLTWTAPKVALIELLYALQSEKVFNNGTTDLKEIAGVCEIEKELTFHIARHTFATTITLTNGVPIESVSKMLGHKNLRTTQHYAKVLDRKVSEDIKLLKDKLLYGGNISVHTKSS